MNRNRAFTLIELLLAIVLSVMLMLAVMAVVSDIGGAAFAGSDMSVPDAELDSATVDSLVFLLRRDIDLASTVSLSRDNEVTLFGYCVLTGSDRRRTHRPVIVLYRLEQQDGRNWLTRRQVLLDLSGNNNVQREVVCQGLRRFEIAMFSDGLPVEDLPSDGGDAVLPVLPEKKVSAQVVTALSPEEDPEESVLHNGLMFYRKNLPAWADRPLPDSGAVAGVAGKDSAKADGDSLHKTTDKAATSWRLRLWSGDSEEPDCDRIITVRGGGC